MSRLLARTLAASLAVLAALAAAPPVPASARIRPFVGIAGVRLGMSAAQVRHVKGRPARGSSRFTYSYPRSGLTVVFDGASKRVLSVSTTSRRERISRSVGVGATKRTVQRRYRGLTCTGGGAFGCKVVDARSRHKMVFSFFRGRVSEITVDATPF